MKFLPLLPLLEKYPFLKPARHIAGEAYHKEALKEAEKFLRFVFLNEKYEKSFEEYSLLCEACEDKSCAKFCKSGAIKNERVWQKCSLCGTCFEKCNYLTRVEDYSRLLARAKISIMSYVYCRAVVSKSEVALRKFAVRAAEYYKSLMEKDSYDKLPEILAANFSIKYKSGFVHVKDYLKAAVRLKAPEWKLYSRSLNGGFVRVSRNEFFRIVEEYLREKLSEKVSYEFEGMEKLLKIVFEFESRRKEMDVEGVKNAECYPPCFKKIISDLKAGVNVPHSARFALASFLLRIGHSVDEVLQIFSYAPDFDEEKARYQVEHIAGMRGSGKEYEVPSCETMKTYHNCFSDCKTKHPMEYYRRCIRESFGRGKKRKAAGVKARSGKR